MFWKKKSKKFEGTLTLGKEVSDKIDRIYAEIEKDRAEKAKKASESSKNSGASGTLDS